MVYSFSKLTFRSRGSILFNFGAKCVTQNAQRTLRYFQIPFCDDEKESIKNENVGLVNE